MSDETCSTTDCDGEATTAHRGWPLCAACIADGDVLGGILMDAPCTSDEARDLAKRWAYMEARRAPGERYPRLTEESERRLFAWVQETMPRMYGRSCLRKGQSLGALLGIPDDGDALARAAGWPS